MMEVTIKKNNMSITLTEPDGESTEELFKLMSKAASWVENYKIVLDDVFNITMDDKDDSIYIEQNVPKDHVQHEGM